MDRYFRLKKEHAMRLLMRGLLCGLVLLAWAGAARAVQAPQTPSGQPQSEQDKLAAQRLRELAAMLSLTSAQREKIRPIVLAEVPRLKAVRDDTSLSKPQKADKLREIFQDTDAKMKPILTPRQMEKLQRIREDEIKKRLAEDGKTPPG
jgi:Spy/CpxP family protein refolding chaperone